MHPDQTNHDKAWKGSDQCSVALGDAQAVVGFKKWFPRTDTSTKVRMVEKSTEMFYFISRKDNYLELFIESNKSKMDPDFANSCLSESWKNMCTLFF